MRRLTRTVLSRHGYNVLVAGGGAEAIGTIQQYEGPTHLLLTDVVLPGMGGRETALRASQLRAECRILFTSGYPDGGVVENGVLDPGTAFLQKPFTPEELLGKVREVGDAP